MVLLLPAGNDIDFSIFFLSHAVPRENPHEAWKPAIATSSLVVFPAITSLSPKSRAAKPSNPKSSVRRPKIGPKFLALMH